MKLQPQDHQNRKCIACSSMKKKRKKSMSPQAQDHSKRYGDVWSYKRREKERKAQTFIPRIIPKVTVFSGELILQFGNSSSFLY